MGRRRQNNNASRWQDLHIGWRLGVWWHLLGQEHNKRFNRSDNIIEAA